MKTDNRIRELVGQMFMSPEIALKCANFGKEADKRMTLGDWNKVAMSQPRLYAVVEAAELSVSLRLADNLNEALVAIAGGAHPKISHIANVAARLAWQAQQPILGQDRLARPVMGYTSASLPVEELVKDEVRVKITAAFVLDQLSQSPDI